MSHLYDNPPVHRLFSTVLMIYLQASSGLKRHALVSVSCRSEIYIFFFLFVFLLVKSEITRFSEEKKKNSIVFWRILMFV